MDTPHLKSYYRGGSTFLSSEQIETIRALNGKVPKYRIIRDFHINENRINDIWKNRERQQQIIQSTISSEISPISELLPELSSPVKLVQTNIDQASSTDKNSKDINHITHSIETPVITSDKRTKKRKQRFDTFNLPNNGASTKAHNINKSVMTNISDAVVSPLRETKKVEHLYDLIEQECKEIEEAERDSERFLNPN